MSNTTELSRLRAELALMSVYRNLGITAGVSLPLEEIERQWPDFGVRASDLLPTIQRLERKGYLSRRGGVPELVTLTLAGENWFDQQPGYLEYRLLVPRASRVAFLRRYGQRKPALARRRRREDAALRQGSA